MWLFREFSMTDDVGLADDLKSAIRQLQAEKMRQYSRRVSSAIC